MNSHFNSFCYQSSEKRGGDEGGLLPFDVKFSPSAAVRFYCICKSSRECTCVGGSFISHHSAAALRRRSRCSFGSCSALLTNCARSYKPNVGSFALEKQGLIHFPHWLRRSAWGQWQNADVTVWLPGSTPSCNDSGDAAPFLLRIQDKHTPTLSVSLQWGTPPPPPPPP